MPKKIPLRMCIGCREHKPKKELIRVVKSPDGEVSVDLTGKKSGRGAYVCRNEACLRKAQKSRQLERALECSMTQELYDRLAQEIAESEDEE
ncbi:MAG: YlxR family protein [Oscillospiraceae bacterium]|nr:YlxR family protein [Oscillospiraceae bacterium]